MAYIRTADAQESENFRRLTGQPRLVSIVVYDADFPADEGQQFISAVLEIEGSTDVHVDLTRPDFAELNMAIEDFAEFTGDTVKFIIELEAP